MTHKILKIKLSEWICEQEMYNHRKTNKGFPNQRVVDHSIKKKVDDKRMKEKCSNSLAFGVGGNGEKKLAKVVWRISCNEHNNNNVGDFSRLFVENKIKINEKQSVFDCCCVVYRAKAGGWRGGGTLREKWKKKKQKKEFIWLWVWFGKMVGGREWGMRDLWGVCENCEIPNVTNSSLSSPSSLEILYSYTSSNKIFTFLNFTKLTSIKSILTF